MMKDISAPAEEGIIEVLNPRGTPPPITLVPMAPRLDTLEGKTIYIVDVNFPLTEPFYEAMQELLAERYPRVNWVFKNKVGSFVYDDPELWAEIKEKGNGAIVGPGHMDTLGPAVVGWSSSLEKMGVPTAPIFSADFPEIPRKAAYDNGVPNLRLTFMPYMVRMPASACRTFLEGNDPVSGKPVLEEMIEALTKPLIDEERKTGTIERSVPRLMEPDNEANLRRYFLENNMTDYLPIVLPTEKRVAEMLRGTSHKADEVVGEMRPSEPHEAWKYTVEQVAVNAVMAGARPEHFPVILAIASTGISSLHSSVGSHVRMLVVNGPIRKEIKMNSGIGALGPFNEANAVIGRAWTIMSKNLGGAGVPGTTYLGTLGSNCNYNNMCFAENEEVLPPGWQPLHVQKGYKPEESVVAVLNGASFIKFGAQTPELRHEIIKRQLLSLQPSGQTIFYRRVAGFGLRATIVISPRAFKELIKEGCDTKEKLGQWLSENIFESEGEEKSPQTLTRPEIQVEVIAAGEEAGENWQIGDFYCIATASVDKWR